LNRINFDPYKIRPYKKWPYKFCHCIKNDRIKNDRINFDHIKSDRIKTDRIKSITDPTKSWLSTMQHSTKSWLSTMQHSTKSWLSAMQYTLESKNSQQGAGSFCWLKNWFSRDLTNFFKTIFLVPIFSRSILSLEQADVYVIRAKIRIFLYLYWYSFTSDPNHHWNCIWFVHESRVEAVLVQSRSILLVAAVQTFIQVLPWGAICEEFVDLRSRFNPGFLG
jgi:hypothetical protein